MAIVNGITQFSILSCTCVTNLRRSHVDLDFEEVNMICHWECYSQTGMYALQNHFDETKAFPCTENNVLEETNYKSEMFYQGI